VNTTLWYTVLAGTPLTAVSVTAAPASPQHIDTTITFTASTTGGLNVQYQFWLYNPGFASWDLLQNYAMQATCAWTPLIPGDYLLSVTAQDAGGTQENTLLWYLVD